MCIWKIKNIEPIAIDKFFYGQISRENEKSKNRRQEIMGLTIHQKSVYLTIYNATMIARSIGKTFKRKFKKEEAEKKLKEFKIEVFKKLDNLTDLMNTNKLTEKHILTSIRKLKEKFNISFGQAQKPINVILKYHFYLAKGQDNSMKKVLHCPIDSQKLPELNRSGVPLTKICEEIYKEIQKKIEVKDEYSAKIDLDNKYDEKSLKYWGLL